MTKKQAANLAIGAKIHAERPGDCRELTVTRKLSPEGVLTVQGGPVDKYWGKTLMLLHLPKDCPLDEANWT